jgi:putative phosphoribosyl transferase
MRRYANRSDAGRQLADALGRSRDLDNAIVLGLPRGGVPVAYEIAQALSLPLDVLVVRKLGLPSQPELAMGAIASGGAVVWNEDVLRFLSSGDEERDRVVAREQAELERRELAYRGRRPPLALSGRVVILVDDGLATGATMEAAVRSVRQLGAARVIVAVPVAATESRDRIARIADEVVCLQAPAFFSAVGQWYEDFSQTSDAEVERLLREGGTYD